MPDVDMKDASAAAAKERAVAEDKEAPVSPKGIRVEDIVRNVELIVKAVETDQGRLTTRAISRYSSIYDEDEVAAVSESVQPVVQRGLIPPVQRTDMLTYVSRARMFVMCDPAAARS